MKAKIIFARMTIYFLQVALFTMVSYGIIFMFYRPTELSFIEWALIMIVVFAALYIPTFVRLIKSS